MSDDGVLILAGATASGKTRLAIELARAFDAEIVGADSRQVYAGIPIGTAMPSPQERAAVAHHCIAFVDPAQRYSAAEYARDALAAIDDIRRRGKRAIVAGGTGFYLRALTGGIELAPAYDEALRSRLAAEAQVHPPEFLHEWLTHRDRIRAERLHVRDRYRVLRALEVALTSRAHVRSSPLRTLPNEGIAFATIFLDVPLAEIDARIERRCGHMLDAGLVEEAERIGERAAAASALGYPQALAYLRGWSTPHELRTTLERATKRYARRQRAWFRNERNVRWLAPEAVADAVRENLGWTEKKPRTNDAGKPTGHLSDRM